MAETERLLRAEPSIKLRLIPAIKWMRGSRLGSPKGAK
jgi:hypothetical protein